MKKQSRIKIFLVGVTASLLFVDAVVAGQFKYVERVEALPAGSQKAVYSSPQSGNLSGGIAMEAYEWTSAGAGGTYQCRILKNSTGKTLNVSLVGINATVITSCSAASGGTCDTTPVSLIGNMRFQCLVATDAFQKGVGGFYQLGISRVGSSASAPAVAPTLKERQAGVR